MFRFGQESKENIRREIEQLTPANTRKSKSSVWRQFTNFCAEKLYNFDRADIPVEELAFILEDYAFNMRKKNSEDYKESVIKVLWNSTAKQLQEYFFEKYNRKFNPFSDIEFLNARAAKNAKRRKLQMDSTKRKKSSSALSADELRKIIKLWDENTPEGLQKKFFFVAAHELASRENEERQHNSNILWMKLTIEGNQQAALSITRFSLRPLKAVRRKWLTVSGYYRINSTKKYAK